MLAQFDSPVDLFGFDNSPSFWQPLFRQGDMPICGDEGIKFKHGFVVLSLHPKADE